MDPGATGETRSALPSPPPPPPPPPPSPSPLPPPPWLQPPKLAGQLSQGWRLTFGLAWAAVIACQAAVWETSRVVGLSTWWLGASSSPQFLLIQLLPFYGPILVTIAGAANWRYAPYLGIVTAVAGAAIGAGDLGRARWIGVVELVLAGGALCVSVAALAGMYRRPRQA